MSGCTENLPGQINRKKSASIHIYIEEMQKLPAFLGISMSLGWKTGEVDQKIHEKYPMLEVENIGEPDFVIRYVPDPEKKRKFWQKMNKFLYPNDIYFE